MSGGKRRGKADDKDKQRKEAGRATEGQMGSKMDGRERAGF